MVVWGDDGFTRLQTYSKDWVLKHTSRRRLSHSLLILELSELIGGQLDLFQPDHCLAPRESVSRALLIGVR